MKSNFFRFTYWIFYLFLTTYPLSLISQTRKMDSINRVLKTEAEDTNKVKTLTDKSAELIVIGKFDSAMLYAQSAGALADKLKYEKGTIQAIYQAGNAYWRQGNYPKSLENHLKAIELSRAIGYKKGISASYSSMGIIYEMEGNYPKALEYYLQALAIFRETGEKTGVASIYSDIGNIYAEQFDYPKSIEYLEKGLAMNEQIGDQSSISNDLINLGVTYCSLSNYSKAIEYYNKALVIEQRISGADAIATIENNLGLVYLLQGDYPKGLEYYSKALDLSRKIGDLEGVGAYLINVGSAYTRLKNYTQAIVYIDSGMHMVKRMGVKGEIVQAYTERTLVDSSTGNFKQALQDYKLYVAYSDSIINEANTKKSVQSEMNFEFEQKQSAQKAEQDKKDAIAEQGRRKQVIIRNIFIGGFALMLALAFFIFRGYQQKQKANIIITLQKAVVEEKQKEILDSIHYAQRIQRALLASDALLSRHLPEYFVLYKPKDIVSGDFYWATEKGNNFYLAICDSTGHGVPGAFMSLLNISFLNEAITEKNISEPNEVFNHARKRLIENISQEGQQDGMDGVLIRMEDNRAVLSYAASYNAPVVIRNKEMLELNADKMAVGASPRQNESFTANTFNLQKGDIVYLFTDGYADQFGGEKGKKFKSKQLQQLIADSAQFTMEKQKEILNGEFESWKGSLEQVDDVLIIGIKV
jgi:serine phosphatase RsbU (regulator of sigma subunit)/Tfp pilus assembly protein PilF